MKSFKKALSVILAFVLIFTAVNIISVSALASGEAISVQKAAIASENSGNKLIQAIIDFFNWLINFFKNLFNPGGPITPEEPTTAAPTTETPTTGEPATEEPSSEEPSTDEPTTVPEEPVEPEIPDIFINQIYGIGKKNNDSQAGSHSFVELYNNSDEAIDLTGMSLQTAEIGGAWNVLTLEGTIPAKHSFLVVLTKYSNTTNARLVINPANADMVWNDVFFPNKGLKVALIYDTDTLEVNNPFDTDGNGKKAFGYIDMIGVAGSDAGSVQDGFESEYRLVQSKQLAARRLNFADTDNNLKDIVGVDFRTADLSRFGPKCVADGAQAPLHTDTPNIPNAILPQVVIDIQDGRAFNTLNKTDYVGSAVSLKNADDNDVAPQSAGIRIRGNSTQGLPKRSVRVKFDTPVSMFGRSANKSWTLLANQYDSTMMRNKVAFDIYNTLEPDNFVSLCEFVDVFVNGIYQGVYTLQDQIEVNPGRIDIDTDTTDPNSGYLLEIDILNSEGGTDGFNCFSLDFNNPEFFANYYHIDTLDHWASYDKYNIALKDPDPDDGVPAESFNFIKDYMQLCLDEMLEKDWEAVCELIDVDSFVKYFMLTEIVGLPDAAGMSMYVVKEKDQPLRMSVPWDYDISFGNANYIHYSPEGDFFSERVNPIFNSLMNIPEFAEIFMNEYLANCSQWKAETLAFIDETVVNYGEALEQNYTVWDWNWGNGWMPAEEINAGWTIAAQTGYLRDWTERRFDWLALAYESRLNNGGTMNNPIPTP